MRATWVCFYIALALPGQLRAQPAPPVPAVPGFELPGAEPGSHSVAELRASSRDLVDREIRVTGYITWIYDCAIDVNPPGGPPVQVRAQGSHDARCQRPQLYLGAARDAPVTRVIRVFDLPAKLTYAAGDHVTVTGTWWGDTEAVDRDLGGVLVYKAIEASRPGPTGPRGAAPARPVLPGPIPLLPPSLLDVDEPTRQQSLADARECESLRARRQLDDAIAACWRATNAWNGNEEGWIALARTQIDKRAWQPAAAAAWFALRLAPERAVAHLLHAQALYELSAAAVREREQLRDNDGKHLPPVAGYWDYPLRSARRAIELQPTLWQAHHLLGLIHLERDEPRAAAEALSAAVSAAPPVSEPYVVLAELYRRWGYAAQAVAIANIGTQHVTGADELAELWYERGLAHAELRDDAGAIDAFTKALQLRPEHVATLFRRSEAYFRRKDLSRARKDLADVVRLGAPAGYIRQQTHRMLLDHS